MLDKILAIIGYYIIARLLYGLFRVVQEVFIMKELDLQERYGRGSWAFVTGCTDGIGLEFAV